MALLLLVILEEFCAFCTFFWIAQYVCALVWGGYPEPPAPQHHVRPSQGLEQLACTLRPLWHCALFVLVNAKQTCHVLHACANGAA